MLAVARIELVARRALDCRVSARTALGWYGEARAFCEALAGAYGFPLRSVVGAVAALSPMQEWRTQLKFTPTILDDFRDAIADAGFVLGADDPADVVLDDFAARIVGPGFLGNKRKAARILLGADPLAVLGGQKVRAFYRCILGDSGAVCVDRHAWSIADGGAVGALTEKRYRTTVAAFVGAAANLRAAFPALASELTPAGVQALTWVWWRDNPGERF